MTMGAVNKTEVVSPDVPQKKNLFQKIGRAHV